MGNIFISKTKSATNANHTLNRSLLHHDLIEKINYLENKIDMLDDKVYVLGQTESDLGISGGHYGNANSGQFIQKFNHGLSIGRRNT